jgi:hypothetical protein
MINHSPGIAEVGATQLEARLDHAFVGRTRQISHTMKHAERFPVMLLTIL